MTESELLTLTPIEWHAVAAIARRKAGAGLTEPELPLRIANAAGRAWLARQLNVTLALDPADAALVRSWHAGLPDPEALQAIAEAERIVREHGQRLRF
jgi:hypothetical protein